MSTKELSEATFTINFSDAQLIWIQQHMTLTGGTLKQAIIVLCEDEYEQLKATMHFD